MSFTKTNCPTSSKSAHPSHLVHLALVRPSLTYANHLSFQSPPLHSYSEYKQRTATNNAGTPFQRSYIFYNVNPNNATTKDGRKYTLDTLVKATVNGLNAKGGLFVTNLDIASTDVYASFSTIWQRFVKSVASISH